MEQSRHDKRKNKRKKGTNVVFDDIAHEGSLALCTADLEAGFILELANHSESIFSFAICSIRHGSWDRQTPMRLRCQIDITVQKYHHVQVDPWAWIDI